LTFSANFLQSKRLFLGSLGESFSAFQSTNLKYPKGYFLIFGTTDIKKFKNLGLSMRSLANLGVRLA
jgi:hypothetical protein